MCGRFADYYETEELVEAFGVDQVIDAPKPSWNVAPTAMIAVVRDVDKGDRHRELRGGRWGLVPSWSKDPLGGARLINARSETVTVKPSFRAAARTRRALVPASGYFEWQAGADGPKTPFYLHPEDEGPIAMAALYEWWWPPAADTPAKGADGTAQDQPDRPSRPGPAEGAGTVPTPATEPLFSAAIITRPATDSTGQIHDRMPLIVPRDAWADWLDLGLRDPTAVRELIASLPDPVLMPRRVGRAVGSVRNNGPHLIAPV
jgi:putative SOS response-associated peptidase YedK